MFPFGRQLTPRPATPEDRRRVVALTRRESRVHMHLDWKPVEDWLGEQPFWVAERGSRLVGALACLPDRPDTAWLRLFAVADNVPADKIWDLLWPPCLERLPALSVERLAALSLEPWTRPLYESAGFARTHSVVVLNRPALMPLPAAPDLPSIRYADASEVAAIAAVDLEAFEPPWQLSPAMLRLALTQADCVTVLERDGQIAGYQLSTPNRGGAHLARLAVRPAYRGQGLGSALVAHLVQHYQRRGGAEITVNTQDNNLASLGVYQRLGFEPTGAEFPVYQRPAVL